MYGSSTRILVQHPLIAVLENQVRDWMEFYYQDEADEFVNEVKWFSDTVNSAFSSYFGTGKVNLLESQIYDYEGVQLSPVDIEHFDKIQETINKLIASLYGVIPKDQSIYYLEYPHISRTVYITLIRKL